MTNSVSLSLPMSATALRLGATLLADLAAQADVIYAEIFGEPRNFQLGTYAAGAASFGCDTAALTDEQLNTPFETAAESRAGLTPEQLAEHAAIVADVETEAERIQRLHGNVAGAGMEPAITQETLPEVKYEIVVIGVERNPLYAGALATHSHESLTAAGWSDEQLLNQEYLQEVTEQRPLAAAPGASAAPSAPAPAAPGVTVQLDKDGFPWDSRIHSDAAEKLTAKGVWKTRKNLVPGYKEQVEAELRAVMNAGIDPNVASGAEVKATVTTATAAPTPTPPPAAPIATPAPAPTPAPAAPAAAPTPGNAFADFTRWLVGHTQAKRFTQTEVVAEIKKLGLSQIPDLAKRTDLIAVVMTNLSQAHGL